MITEADTIAAASFFGAWGLLAHPPRRPIIVGRADTGHANGEAMIALAAAFSSARAAGAAASSAASESSGALLRRAVGVVSDLERLGAEVRAVLDAYGAGRECGRAGDWTDRCGLVRGHAGPCGEVGGSAICRATVPYGQQIGAQCCRRAGHASPHRRAGAEWA
jgi:hypothetical protein